MKDGLINSSIQVFLMVSESYFFMLYFFYSYTAKVRNNSETTKYLSKNFSRISLSKYSRTTWYY